MDKKLKQITFEDAVKQVIQTKEDIPKMQMITDFDRDKYPIIQECENYVMYDYAPDVMIIEEFPKAKCSYLAVLDYDGCDIGELGYCETNTNNTIIYS